MISKIIYSVIFSLIWCGSAPIEASDKTEQLILIVSKEHQLISPDEILSVEALADELGLEFVLLDDAKGLPSELTTLPAIYFQNARGRSKYYGRYKNLSRIKNFVRTAKMFHSSNDTSLKKDILVWQNQKAKIYAPIKVTALEGQEPHDFDPVLFLQEAHEAIASGMQKYELRQSDEQSKYARSFYFNIYPYLDEWDNLSVTYELFSQYNCVKPVSRKMEPLIPAFPWSQREDGFNQIGQLIEEDILRYIETAINGDAFVVVPESMQVSSWEALGLGLDASNSSKSNRRFRAGTTLPRKWKIEEDGASGDPLIIFSFLSPVDSYAGEVTAVEGTINLDENYSFEQATGSFSVDIADVTMGAEDFDDSVQNKMLKRALFPKAYFEFVKVEGANRKLVTGQIQQLKVHGKFTMMGITIPVTAEAVIEPVQEDGVTKLEASCQFQIPLFEKFSVKGPDGPSPAKDILQFYMKFNLIENI